MLTWDFSSSSALAPCLARIVSCLARREATRCARVFSSQATRCRSSRTSFSSAWSTSMLACTRAAQHHGGIGMVAGADCSGEQWGCRPSGDKKGSAWSKHACCGIFPPPAKHACCGYG